MYERNLDKNWSVIQDVHDLGEKLGLYKPDWDPCEIGHQISEWEPIESLGHLQLQFANNPYFGRELRYFNSSPWWYKCEFEVSKEEAEQYALIKFEAVDYFCKVWLNGELLGEHEGYSSPFEFDISNLLFEGVNILIVKVWAPWDSSITEGAEHKRTFTIIRDMFKGTYEHGDGLIQRDVNPVGIWGPIKLYFHTGIFIKGRPYINIQLSDDLSIAECTMKLDIWNLTKFQKSATIHCSIIDKETGVINGVKRIPLCLRNGKNEVNISYILQEPKLWNTWDRGRQNLYTAIFELEHEGICVDRKGQSFGVRKVELIRDEEQTVFYLNGKKLFLRGTCYFPDVYISRMHFYRYIRDLNAIKAAGFNAIRVHVHVEKQEFYDLCDKMGIAVVQDSEFNWTHPNNEKWCQRILSVWKETICSLRNHPSLFAWICLNEPAGGSEGSLMNKSPGPQMLKTVIENDPGRPIIKGSFCEDDIDSGDSHNYIGSLAGEHTHYTEIRGTKEKLNTEYGFDAPGAPENLKLISEIYKRLKEVLKNSEDIQYYQYRLLKFYTEHYRLMKYAPCAGYFQFMFIDLCPQSFYGIYDWWGIPKKGLDAMLESNMPLGIFMEYSDKPIAIWVVNDYIKEFTDCNVRWVVSDDHGNLVVSGNKVINIPSDCIIRVCDLQFSIEPDKRYNIILYVDDCNGNELTRNAYYNAFNHPEHPKGHPSRISHELGMRLYWG